MGCQCYQIGGPFIAEDPDCPAHGTDGYAPRLEKAEEQIAELRAEIEALKQHESCDLGSDCPCYQMGLNDCAEEG